MSVFTDVRNRIIYVSRPLEQRNKVAKINGAEPTGKGGGLRYRAGKLKYGLQYTSSVLNILGNRQKIKGGQKFWRVVVREPGTGIKDMPFTRSSSNVKPLTMGRANTKHSRPITKSSGYTESRFIKDRVGRGMRKQITQQKIVSF